MQREVLEAQKRELGADHPETLATAACLASTLWKHEKYAEA